MTHPWMIYLLLSVSPLPLASARPLWQWMWVSYVGMGMLFFSVWSFRHRSEPTPKPPVVSIILVSMFVIYGYAQSLLPFASKELLGVAGGDGLLISDNLITVDYAKTIANASYFLTHLSFFCLVFLSCNRRIKAVQTLRFCGITVVIYAIYGLVIFMSGNDTILWFQKSSNFHSLTSTFVNRNNFAAFAGLGLQCLVAYAYFWMRDELLVGRSGWELYSHVLNRLLTRAWWLPLAIALTAVALFLTNSRAGVGSVVFAVLLLVVLSSNAHQRRLSMLRRLVGPGLILACTIGLFALSGRVLESRLQFDFTVDQRFAANPISIDIIAEQPLTGYGLGTFNDVFRIYRDETINIYFDRAHNDYLELAITAGVPAALLLVLAFLLLVVFFARILKFGDQYRSFIALGISTSFQLGLQSIVDFPLQIPAISYMWVAILAASVALADQCQTSAQKTN